LTTAKLAALGADVVKVEMPGVGDRIRLVPPFGPDGESPQHMAQNWGKRSVALDLRDQADRTTFLRLAEVADVIVENQLVGSWAKMGIDFAEMRRRRPELIVCSVTGFGQTGPLANLPSHGLNMDAIADCLIVEWQDGEPRLGWTFTSWGNELGSTYAALAITAALLEARATGQGAWIDLSCWDAVVEAHRTELAMATVTGQPFNLHTAGHGALYNTYLSKDHKPVLLGALERKFWVNFCRGVGREDLIGHHTGAQIYFGLEDEALRKELAAIFVKATAAEWDQRFVDWDCPGCTVLQIDDVMKLAHFEARGIVEGDDGAWPNVANAIRWHHVGQRAGSGLTPPPALGADNEEVLDEWLGHPDTMEAVRT
jgi:crotonobetainyl-CoA:carnitine CoA-transferase CaiB-like acyl-CoA transferase